MDKLSSNSPCFQQWQPSEVDALTDVGVQQMEALGQALGRELSGHAPVWCSSSSAPRVQASGGVVAGCLARLGLETAPAALPAPPDHLYRAWALHPPYLAAVERLATAPDFHHLATTHAAQLAVLQAHSVALEPAGLWLALTYWREALDTEAFWPDQERQASTRVLREANLVDFVDHHARQVWSRRFFMGAEVAEWIGGALRDWVAEQARTGGAHLHAVHDYSLLALLAAMGLPHYPAPVLGYGAYILITVPDGAAVLNLTFNPEPFLPGDLTVHFHRQVSVTVPLSASPTTWATSLADVMEKNQNV